jgi:hypothetical protein
VSAIAPRIAAKVNSIPKGRDRPEQRQSQYVVPSDVFCIAYMNCPSNAQRHLPCIWSVNNQMMSLKLFHDESSFGGCFPSIG